MSPDTGRIVLASGAGLLATFGLTILAVPAVIRFAPKEQLADRLEDRRSGELRRIPRLGGVAMMIATALTLAAVAMTTGFGAGGREALSRLGPALMLGAGLVFLVGLLDDLRGVRPIGKLVVQTLAAGIVIAAGMRVDTIAVPWIGRVELGIFAIPLTVVWIVGVSNAINLVDGLDGLASSITLACLAGVFGAAIVLHHTTIAVLAASLAGAAAGFLVFNRAPARIFLGDSGSLTIGFVLACLTLDASRDASGAVLVLVPILSLAYPLLDTVVAMLRRWLRGDPLSRADGRHIHHQLCAVGFSPPEAMWFIAVSAVFAAALGLGVAFERPGLTAAVALISTLGVGLVFSYGLRWLEYDEFLEAGASVVQFVRGGRRALQVKIRARELARAIADAHTVAQIEAVMADARPALGLLAMQLARESARRDVHLDVPASVSPLGVWKLDRPVAITSDSHPANPVVLRLWGLATDPAGTQYAARVAAILTPVLRQWFDDHGLDEARQRFPETRSLTPPQGARRQAEAHVSP